MAVTWPFFNILSATSTDQWSLTARLLKMGLSDSDWLKIKCNNSIGRRMGFIIWYGGGHNKFDWGVEGINLIGRCWQIRKKWWLTVARLTLPPAVQVYKQANFAHLSCVIVPQTIIIQFLMKINTFWHLYSVKIGAKVTQIQFRQ